MTGVPILAVVKADAYGLGIKRISECLADKVAGFCVFSLAEAAAAQLWERTAKPAMALGCDGDESAEDYIAQHVRPAVWTVDRAAAFKKARPILSVDTGMQRFSCPPEKIGDALRVGECDEAFTHATRPEQVTLLIDRVGGRHLRLHAAGSSLLDIPTARLDAVRPGIALYRGAVRVSTQLIDARISNGPVGYTQFSATHHGVIRGGYFNGLRTGPCLINGRPSRIVEVGMQSAYVETASGDKIGDEVVFLGDTLKESEVAAAWGRSEHDVLTTLCSAGRRVYVD
jgi:alanine racemase